jgi:hypothetical protein
LFSRIFILIHSVFFIKSLAHEALGVAFKTVAVPVAELLHLGFVPKNNVDGVGFVYALAVDAVAIVVAIIRANHIFGFVS